MWNKLHVIGLAVIVSLLLAVGTLTIGRTAISELAGLAVAQTSTVWNNVIDAAKGDGQTAGILGQSSYLYNGATFDRARGTSGSANVNIVGTTTPADAFVNPTTTTSIWSLNGVFNGTTWDRQRTTTADALVSTGIAANGNVLFNGSTFDRQDGISNTNNTATTTVGVQYSTPLSTWSSINSTTGATAATISKASGGGSVRHVATGLTICFHDTAIAAGPLLAHLRDGATGAGTILKTWIFSAPVAATSRCESITGINITGSAATAMTLEFAAAPAATASETVSLQGYSTP